MTIPFVWKKRRITGKLKISSEKLSGMYNRPGCSEHYVDDADVEEFDKAFPPKEKRKLPTQLF